MNKILLTVFLLFGYFTPAKNTETKDPDVVYILPAADLTYKSDDQRIYEAARAKGLNKFMSKLLVAQARHETGNFKSRLFRKHLNAFGMMKRRSDTLAINSLGRAEGRKGYATYQNIDDSTGAVIQLLKERKCPMNFTSARQYAKWLKLKGYYSDKESNYSNALASHLKKINVV